MKELDKNYIILLIIHVFIAGAIFLLPFFSKIYFIFIFIAGLLYVIKNKNKNNEVLLVSGYITGAEVFIRATNGALLYEFSKYSIIIFIFLGMLYSGFSKKATAYWIYLLLLIPGVIMSVLVLNPSAEERKVISFVISGPVCLGVTALYTYQRKITVDNLYRILLAIGLPILTLTVYLFLYTPSIKDVVQSTGSNFATSGGFGPNQVSTILGLGFFIFASRLLLQSKNKFTVVLNAFIAIIIIFRAIVTFSRGGVMTAIVMTIALFILVYFFSNKRVKAKLHYFYIFSIIAAIGLWLYSSVQTSGLIDKRYTNKDALGREKSSRLSGREDLMSSEIEIFIDNPFLGAGVGKSKELREEVSGIVASSHNEITRLLAEHGTLGVIMFIILLLTPFILYHKQHIFLIPFFIFWLLTINHAAMRIAAPAFIYALTLLKVHFNEPKKSLKRIYKMKQYNI
ncbi:MAG TPA: O-antigen ligase family protein [Flavobacterium sp.]